MRRTTKSNWTPRVMPHSGRWIRLSACIALLSSIYASADTPVTFYETDSGSQLWLEVSSNVSKHLCRADQVTGAARLDVGLLSRDGHFSSATDSAQYAILATMSAGLTCGNERMNRDIHRALKVGDFPIISFQLESADISDSPDSLNQLEVRISGQISVAGQERAVQTIAKATRLRSRRLRIAGRLPISMRDFDIEPPTAFFGLIRARDQLSIHFDLLVVDAVSGSIPVHVLGSGLPIPPVITSGLKEG